MKSIISSSFGALSSILSYGMAKIFFYTFYRTDFLQTWENSEYKRGRCINVFQNFGCEGTWSKAVKTVNSQRVLLFESSRWPRSKLLGHYFGFFGKQTLRFWCPQLASTLQNSQQSIGFSASSRRCRCFISTKVRMYIEYYYGK